MTKQAGLDMTWSATSKTGFLVTRRTFLAVMGRNFKIVFYFLWSSDQLFVIFSYLMVGTFLC